VKAGGSIALIEAGWNLCGTFTNPAIPVYDELMKRSLRGHLKKGKFMYAKAHWRDSPSFEEV